MEFATAYGEKIRVKTKNTKPTMTKQSLGQQQNINHIIKQYKKTGTVPQLNALEAQYGEITSQSLLEAHQMIEAAETSFNSLPSEVRKTFNQDAGAFIDYATNPENIKQMTEWGLMDTPINHFNMDGTVNTDGNIETGGEDNPKPNPLPNEK